jgi:hypothetical protein
MTIDLAILETELDGLENAANALLERVKFIRQNIPLVLDNPKLKAHQTESIGEWVHAAGQWHKSIELTLKIV